MGAGKTTIGREVAHRLGLNFFDLDEEIVAQSCFESVREIFEVCGEAFFRIKEAEVLTKLLRHDSVVVATGGGVVTNELAIPDLKRSAQEGEVVYLRAEFGTLVGRVGGDLGRPLFQDFDKARALFESRQEYYSRFASWTVQVDSDTLESIVEMIVSTVQRNQVL
jgi:shikimate kinase